MVMCQTKAVETAQAVVTQIERTPDGCYAFSIPQDAGAATTYQKSYYLQARELRTQYVVRLALALSGLPITEAVSNYIHGLTGRCTGTVWKRYKLAKQFLETRQTVDNIAIKAKVPTAKPTNLAMRSCLTV